MAATRKPMTDRKWLAPDRQGIPQIISCSQLGNSEHVNLGELNVAFTAGEFDCKTHGAAINSGEALAVTPTEQGFKAWKR